MINILSVNPTGYFSYGMHETIMLHQKGLVLLEGINKDKTSDSNGSGKTSTFNTLAQILFGRNPTEHTGESILNRTLKKCFGVATFETDDGQWRIIETRKWRRTDSPPDLSINKNSLWVEGGEVYYGTDLFLERLDPGTGKWLDERATNIATGNTRLDMKATRKKILDILGITYDQFMSVAYLAQQQSLKFLSGGHKERMEILAEITDMSAWDKRVTRVREDLTQCYSTINALKGKIDGLSESNSFMRPVTVADIEAAQTEVDAANLDLGQIDSTITALTDQVSGLNKSIATIEASNRALSQQARDVSNNINMVSSLKSQEYVNHFATLDTAKNMVPRANVMDLEEKVNTLRTQISYRNLDLSDMMNSSGRCTKCKSAVTLDHLLRHKEIIKMDIASMSADLAVATLELSNTHKEYEDALAVVVVAHEAAWVSISAKLDADISELKYAITCIDEDIKANNLEVGALAKMRDGVPVAYYTRLRGGALSRVAEAGAALGAVRARERESAGHVAAISAARGELANAEARARYLALVERLFGDKGMKAQKLDSAILAINKILMDSIKDITDQGMHVYISKTRDKADGGVVIDLQVIVRDGNKVDVPYELYSGGEKQQIILAFVTAFWQLATKYGSGVNLLCLDEIFGPLDQGNTSNMFLFLEKMSKMGKSSIFIVTHNQAIKKTVSFDQIWTVVKENGTSIIKQDIQ